VNGKRHRENGPAIERADGTRAWYINDVQFTEEEFNQRNKPLFGATIVVDGVEYKLS
jgi:hypothetical protein